MYFQYTVQFKVLVVSNKTFCILDFQYLFSPNRIRRAVKGLLIQHIFNSVSAIGSLTKKDSTSVSRSAMEILYDSLSHSLTVHTIMNFLLMPSRKLLLCSFNPLILVLTSGAIVNMFNPYMIILPVFFFLLEKGCFWVFLIVMLK